jgi:hypothetical protein
MSNANPAKLPEVTVLDDLHTCVGATWNIFNLIQIKPIMNIKPAKYDRLPV